MVSDEVKRNIWRGLDPIDWVTVMTRASGLWITMVGRMKVKFVRRSVYCRLAPTYWRPDKRKVLKRLRNVKRNDIESKVEGLIRVFLCVLMVNVVLRSM